MSSVRFLLLNKRWCCGGDSVASVSPRSRRGVEQVLSMSLFSFTSVCGGGGVRGGVWIINLQQSVNIT